ncbi:MAG: TAXI family TRAP transporter solute-binding subunit [Desulfobacterales bacterium]|nr:TAXI family TRAP transporter solute-binding subunit [Desulfobacterales bacterium]
MKKRLLIGLMAIIFQTGAWAQTFEWTSGQLGGGWYTMTSGLAKFIEESNPDIQIKVVPGGGTANPTKVDKNKSQFGLGLDCLAFLAKEGKDIYKGKPHHNLMMIGGSLSDTLFHFVKADGAKYSFEELFKEGKNVRVGVTKAGSSDEKIFSWTMDYYGTSYKDMKKRGIRINHGNYSELSSQYKDKLIDYVFVNLGLPGAAVIDMLISRKGDVHPLPDTLMSHFSKNYGYKSGIIKAGLYKNQENDVKTGNMGTVILVNKSVSEDVVYRITKAICENESKLADIHGSMASYKCATAIKNATIPVHPGALKYYREIGYVK